MSVLDDNPWNVDSLYDLQFFNCPSPFCIYKNNSKQEFVNHAFYFHPESEQYLRNLKDYSLNDVDIPLETKVDSNQLSPSNELDIKVPIIYFFDDRSPSRHKQSFFI